MTDVARPLTHLHPTDARWRAFAEEHASSPLQLPSWLDVLIGAYRRPTRVTTLFDDAGTIRAAVPMMQSKLPWRRSWTALPYTDVLEPVARDADASRDLLTAVAQTQEESVLLRSHSAAPGWTARELGTVQLIDIADGSDAVLRQASSATRRNVKRARRTDAGLLARPIDSAREFLGPNLTLMAQTRRRLGAPTQPRRYWSHLWKLHERGGAVTIGVYQDDRLVASGTFLVGRRHGVYKYGASDASAWALRPNFLMFATAVDHLAGRGLQTLDFGITDLANSSLRDFKTRWGGEERPAHYSATDPHMLPRTLEPGHLLTRGIQRAPTAAGRLIGTIAYPFVG